MDRHVRASLQKRYHQAFSPQWWKDHPNAAKAYWRHSGPHHHPWTYWWRHATWGAVAGFIVGSAWTAPYLYDYGGNVYYEGDTVYVEGQAVASADQYYEQASAIATEPAEDQATSDDWMPLGVFALAHSNPEDSNLALQLAVSQQGIIAGTLYSQTKDDARPMEGAVDKQSQRAAWTFADGKDTDIVMETGIYNLTEDETDLLIHFGPTETETWRMIRLEQPQSDRAAAD